MATEALKRIADRVTPLGLALMEGWELEAEVMATEQPVQRRAAAEKARSHYRALDAALSPLPDGLDLDAVHAYLDERLRDLNRPGAPDWWRRLSQRDRDYFAQRDCEATRPPSFQQGPRGWKRGEPLPNWELLYRPLDALLPRFLYPHGCWSMEASYSAQRISHAARSAGLYFVGDVARAGVLKSVLDNHLWWRNPYGWETRQDWRNAVDLRKREHYVERNRECAPKFAELYVRPYIEAKYLDDIALPTFEQDLRWFYDSHPFVNDTIEEAAHTLPQYSHLVPVYARDFLGNAAPTPKEFIALIPDSQSNAPVLSRYPSEEQFDVILRDLLHNRGLAFSFPVTRVFPWP